MALANDPQLLIADEPTTALDVTVQAQILELIDRLRSELDMAVVLITHDLGVVAEVTDHITVMYAGQVVESAPKETIFRAPEHPYTWGLLRSIPRLDRPRDEALVPISGRPPSMISPPTGCRFHPRGPYVQPAHTRVVPDLVRGEGTDHEVRCLLVPETRKRLWQELDAGHKPEEIVEQVPIETRAQETEEEATA
jgi:peptide/nickel transport system ATP-binding protein